MALADHFSLVREHRRIPRRVAVVGDQAWQKLALRLLSGFTVAATQLPMPSRRSCGPGAADAGRWQQQR